MATSLKTALLLVLSAASTSAQLRGGGGQVYGGGGGGPTCPTGSFWAGSGRYCISGALYNCAYAGSAPTFISNCYPGYCQSNVPGVPDQCAATNPYPPVPPPRPTPPPTWNPYPPVPPPQCSRPTWIPSDSCASFGHFKGQDLAAQVCNISGGMLRGGGGQSLCQTWQQDACEQVFDATIRGCCPNMQRSQQAYSMRALCRP